MTRPTWLVAAVAAVASVTWPVAAQVPNGFAIVVVSKATLREPLRIATQQPSVVTVSETKIGGGGASGWRTYAGTTIVSVRGGTASVRTGAASTMDPTDQCRPRRVPAGEAFVIHAGAPTNIENDGLVTLELVDTSVTRGAQRHGPAVMPAAGCGRPAGAMAERVLSIAKINAPFSIASDVPIDVYTARIEIAPGGSVGWHSHSGAVVLGVNEGTLNLVEHHDDVCHSRVVREGRGHVEPAGNVDEARNDGVVPMVLYNTSLPVLGAPPVLPAAPSTCGR